MVYHGYNCYKYPRMSAYSYINLDNIIYIDNNYLILKSFHNEMFSIHTKFKDNIPKDVGLAFNGVYMNFNDFPDYIKQAINLFLIK